MSQLSTFYSPLTAADLGLGNSANVTFGSVTTGAVTGSGNATFGSIQNTPIGNTTPNSGAFTTLNANNGTITASAPVLNLSQTWNNAAVTFRGVNWSFVETAAGGSSEVFRISTGAAGTSAIFNIRRDGNATFANAVNVGTIGGNAGLTMQGTSVRVGSTGFFAFTNLFGNAYGTADVNLFRDAAATLALRDLANPQAFRIYNTTDAGLTNFERGFLRWSSNVLQIGTEKGGTGSARALELQTDGVTRLNITTGGTVNISTSTGPLAWQSSTVLRPVDGNGTLRLSNNAQDDFNRLQFGGTTSSFPALKRSSTILQARLANDSDFCPLQGQLRIHQNAVSETITATHTLTLFDAAGTAYKVPCVAA